MVLCETHFDISTGRAIAGIAITQQAILRLVDFVDTIHGLEWNLARQRGHRRGPPAARANHLPNVGEIRRVMRQ